jgi:hypothetical protein
MFMAKIDKLAKMWHRYIAKSFLNIYLRDQECLKLAMADKQSIGFRRRKKMIVTVNIMAPADYLLNIKRSLGRTRREISLRHHF